jgi:pimeloyl-ACP methyl ester carboxylesterase
MAILSIVRLLASLFSLLILAAAGYLLWSWSEGEVAQISVGELVRVREDWRLWAGLVALAWSLFGRVLAGVVLAKRDVRPSRMFRGDGETVVGASNSRLYTETLGPLSAKPVGSGAPTVIFTHGWGMDSTFWSYAKLDLSKRFRVVVWDLPGMGRSKASGSDAIRLESFAADLSTLIGRCGPQPVVLVGHSIGGMAIQTLLRDHPEIQDRVRGVVLLNTTYTNPLRTMVLGRMLRALQRPVLEPMARLTIWLSPLVWLSKWQSYLSGATHVAMRLGCGRFVTRSQLEHVALLATRASPAVEARGDLAMFRWDATDALRTLRVPALVIGGDKDIVTKLEASHVMANESPLATLRIVEDVNHMGPMERADTYNQAIMDFADTARAASPIPALAV